MRFRFDFFFAFGASDDKFALRPLRRVRKNVKSILELNVIAGTIKFQFYLSVNVGISSTSVLDVGSTSCVYMDITKGHEIQFDGCSANLVFFLYCFCRYV